MASRWPLLCSSDRRVDDARGHVAELDVLALRCPHEELERLALVATLRGHEDSLRLLDDRPRLHGLTEPKTQVALVPIRLRVGHNDGCLRREEEAVLAVVLGEGPLPSRIKVHGADRTLVGDHRQRQRAQHAMFGGCGAKRWPWPGFQGGVDAV